jgi:prepilin-type N-terminal cleavage/methylation domain-containing protein/prepilin-type processing-associated H-X9-DG protein
MKMLHPTKVRLTLHGFTLIELLTVIAIIGILAAILIPVVGSVRDNAKASACVSQLRDLGLGVYLYAEEYGEKIPPNLNPNTGGTPGVEWGSYVEDRALGLLLSADKGGPNIPGWSASYLDSAHLLYCPSSRIADLRAANPGYKDPDDISKDNRIVRAGYIWIYYPQGNRRDNATIGAENPNRPYIFDFPLPGTGGLSPVFTVNPHQSRINVWHVGGHVTSVNADEAKKATSREMLYDFITFRQFGVSH